VDQATGKILKPDVFAGWDTVTGPAIVVNQFSLKIVITQYPVAKWYKGVRSRLKIKV